MSCGEPGNTRITHRMRWSILWREFSLSFPLGHEFIEYRGESTWMGKIDHSLIAL